MRFILSIAVVLAAACAPLRSGYESSVPPLARTASPQPPLALTDRLRTLGQAFEGRVGIAVHDLQAGWTADFQGLTLQPQQSVSKLWVAIALLDAVDKGEIRLDEPVTVRREDLSVFNQPIREKMVGGVYQTNLADLMVNQISLSDNAANDIIMRRVGGPAVVQRMIADKRLGPIQAGPEEKVLQTRIAALDWKPDYSFGRVFWTDRDLVDPARRHAALDAYIAHPDDGATPVAIVQGLARLKKGELLSPASTALLLRVLGQTETGPMRLKAGLPEGWTIAHKTGTGQDLGDQTTGYNDVGLITAPDGRTYAVAVMIATTHRPVPERQDMMALVSAAVAAVHDGRDPATAVPPIPPPSPLQGEKVAR